MNGHRSNLSRVKNHYRRANHATKSDHLLVRILQTLPSGKDMDLLSYRDMIEDYQNELIRHFDLSSPVNVGKSFYPGVFMGEDSEEILVAVNRPFSIGEISTNWQNVSPVQFLRHPKTNLNLELPIGQPTPGETGPSVILIDIPLLACQYRLWRQRELRINPEYPKTPMQFVINFPLTNSLDSLIDVAYFNQLRALFFGEPLEDVRVLHPFYLNNYFEKTKDGNIELIHSYLDRRMSFGEMLESIDAIGKPNLRKVIEIPSMAFTRQVKWALTVARLPLISMLVLWEERAGGSFNRKELNRVKRSLRQLRSDRALDSLGTQALADQTKIDIERDIAAYV
tara:strand:- start:268 stop:1284 length:1017 start_codon:yes stop_codon:yes gene_type:complete